MKTYKEIEAIVEQVNAETNGEFMVGDCTKNPSYPAILIVSNKYKGLSLVSTDWSGKGEYKVMSGNAEHSKLSCNADDLFSYLIDEYWKFDEDMKIYQARKAKAMEIKKQLKLTAKEVVVKIEKIVKETEKAINVQRENDGDEYYIPTTYWLPKSQIQVVEGVYVAMPKWLAKKNCLSYIL